MTETMWTCCDDEVYDTPGIREHLRSVHAFVAPVRIDQRAVLHLDGEGFALNTYECQIGDLTLHKTVRVTPDESEAAQ